MAFGPKAQDQTIIGQINHCRLEAAETYIQTGSAENVQLNSALKGISFVFSPRIDKAYTSLAFHVGSVGTAGDLSLAVYDITSGSRVEHKTAWTVGVTATGWQRTTFTSLQFYRSRIYEVQINGTAGADISVTCRRWNTSMGSMFPDSCYSRITTDGWSSDSEAQQNSKPALANVVMGASVNMVPPLILGRFNGKHCLGHEIPATGLELALDGKTADTLYYVYIDDNGLRADTDLFIPDSDGILVSSADSSRLYLGMIYPKELQSSYQGPVDAMDARLVLNKYNLVPKSLGKLNPYSSNTSESIGGSGEVPWQRWNGDSDDWKIEFLSDVRYLTRLKAKLLGVGYSDLQTAIGVDSASAPYFDALLVSSEFSSFDFPKVSELIVNIPDGYHFAHPLLQNLDASDANTMRYFYEYSDELRQYASFLGSIWA